MPVLREIVARLGIDLDKRGFAAADRRVDEVVKNLNKAPTAANAALASVGQFFGAAAVGFAGLKLVELASDANETLNVLDASFGENSKAVQAWASDFALSAGRSEFGMQEMAGTLGAVLNPLMERNQDLAASMSTRFSALAVDLGSFFNVADDQALNALRSGLTGEAEALKRFGVVMNEATLEAFALSTGIRGNVKDMSIAEKTALRYEFILDQTALAQGDAARTSEGWANATKGLLTALKDLGTRIGLTIIPLAETVVTTTRNVVRAFLEWQRGTNFLKAGLIVLGAIGAKVALGLLRTWWPVIVPILKFVAIVTVAALVLGDFLTFMERGDSVIGRFIDSIFGPGSASAAVDNLWEAWDRVTHFWTDTVIPTMEQLGAALFDVAADATTFWGEFFGSFGAWVSDAMAQLQPFLDAVQGAFQTAQRFGFDVGVGQAARDAGPSAQGERNLVQATVPRPLQSFQPAAANQSIMQSVTVNVPPGTSQADASRIATTSSQAQAALTRRTLAALTQEAE